MPDILRTVVNGYRFRRSFVLTSAQPFQANLRSVSERQESRHKYIPEPACQKPIPRQGLKNYGRSLSNVPVACIRMVELRLTRRSQRWHSKLTGHQNSCDLCKPTAQAPESGGPAFPHYAGHQGHPGYIDGTRRVDAVLVPAQKWTIRRRKKGGMVASYKSDLS